MDVRKEPPEGAARFASCPSRVEPSARAASRPPHPSRRRRPSSKTGKRHRDQEVSGLGWGANDPIRYRLVDDIQLALSELATIAVVRARTPFTVVPGDSTRPCGWRTREGSGSTARRDRFTHEDAHRLGGQPACASGAQRVCRIRRSSAWALVDADSAYVARVIGPEAVLDAPADGM
jgi:hypothetical protein